MARVSNAPVSRLSFLNDEGTYPKGWTIIEAFNSDVVLERHGRRRLFTDLTSAYGSVNFGHRNPEIDPFQGARADIAPACYPHEAEELSGWLCERLDLPDHRVLFQVGGSFAVSSALALAQRVRPGKIVAIRGGFHGLGLDSLSVTTAQRKWAIQNSPLVELLQSRIIHIEPGACEPDWRGISCFLFEPIQGANGYIPLNLEWIGNLVESARRHGVVVIADEIQAGFYRHGYLSPTRAAGIKGDIHLYSKSLTNGHSPLSAVVYDGAYDDIISLESALAHTFQTSVYGYRAGIAVSRYLDDNPPEDAISAIEKLLDAAAYRLERTTGVKEVYITGPSLSFGLESPARARALVWACFDRYIMILGGGADGNRIRIAPPLTIEPAILEGAIAEVLEALDELLVAREVVCLT